MMQKITIKWGISSRQGVRWVMEDAYSAVQNTVGNEQELFLGLYDGHSGALAAQAAAHGLACEESCLDEQHRVKSLYSLITQSSYVGEACYIKAFHDFDEHFRVQSNCKSGTTAFVAHVKLYDEEPHLYYAWVGDTRGILFNQEKVLEASCDHKPNRADEKERIYQQGGFVTSHDGCSRVGGRLAVSRALGDAQIKGLVKGITATPEVKKIHLSQDYQVLVVATDGVWDVVSNEEAAKLVYASLSGNLPGIDVPEESYEYVGQDGNDSRLIDAARMLRDEAKHKGSTDNISVAVVELCSSGRVSY